MRRFYFHLCNLQGRSDDTDGCEFADLEAAYLDAHRAIIEISAEMLSKRQDPSGYAFEICDGDGAILLTLEFVEALHPNARRPRDFFALRRQAEQHIARGRGLKAELEASLNEVRRNLETLRRTVRE